MNRELLASLPGRPFAPADGCSLAIIAFDAYYKLPADVRRKMELYQTRSYSDGVRVWIEMASYRVREFVADADSAEQAVTP